MIVLIRLLENKEKSHLTTYVFPTSWLDSFNYTLSFTTITMLSTELFSSHWSSSLSSENLRECAKSSLDRTAQSTNQSFLSIRNIQSELPRTNICIVDQLRKKYLSIGIPWMSYSMIFDIVLRSYAPFFILFYILISLNIRFKWDYVGV